jgi:hypothetical protein
MADLTPAPPHAAGAEDDPKPPVQFVFPNTESVAEQSVPVGSPHVHAVQLRVSLYEV